MFRPFGPIIIGIFLVAPSAWAETPRATKKGTKAGKVAPNQAKKTAKAETVTPKRAKKKPRRLSRSVIRKALKQPRGSICLGSTSWGKVKKARKLALRGRDYAFFKHIKERKTHYGTKELGRLIRHVARKVARKHSGTKLQLSVMPVLRPVGKSSGVSLTNVAVTSILRCSRPTAGAGR